MNPTPVDDLVSGRELALSSEEARTAAENNLDFLAAMAMPLIFQYMFPPVFKAVWDWLLGYTKQQRVFPKLALGLPRGFGKTTFIKIYLLYCILFTKKRFLLVISSSAGLAENIIADVVDMLEESNIKRLFGDWKLGIQKDTQAIKKFTFRGRTIIIAALGAGSSLRGLNLKNERPDVMLFDDIQTREQADSQIQSENLERWMYGTAMKAKSPHGCVYIFIGNMYPTKWSILRKLKKNPTWVKFIVGGILADGTSLWEELHPYEQLMEEFEADLAAGHPEIFFAEVLNDEDASANNLIDLSRLPDPPFDWDEPIGGNFIVIDPATDKVGADAVSVGYCEVRAGLPALVHVTEGSLSPGDTIRVALEYCFKHNCRLVAVEANAYQYTFKYWFDFICEQKGIVGIECVDVYSGSFSKNARIISMFKSLMAGELFVHDNAKAQVATQVVHFNPLRKDNTDGVLDLLTYMSKVIEMYGPQVALANVLVSQEGDTYDVLPEEITCSF